MFTTVRLPGATASIMARPRSDRVAVLREVGGLLRDGVRRRRPMRAREFVASEIHPDAGETDVLEQAVAA